MHTGCTVGYTGVHPEESEAPKTTLKNMAGLTQRNGMWYATWKNQNGITEKKSTKVPVKGQDGISAKQAKAYAQQVADSMERLAKGQTTYIQAADALRSVAQASGMGGKMPTVREYLAEFQGMAGAKTESNRKRAFTRFLDYLGKRADMRLDMLTKDDIRGFVRHVLALVAVGTVRLYLANVSAALNRAVEDDLLLKSPMPRIDLAKEAQIVNPELGSDSVERQPFTRDELRILVTQFPAPWRDIVLVSWLTGGQRLGDCCCLRWQSVDFESGVISFRTDKTGNEITNPIRPTLRARLLAIREEQGGQEEYVFPNMARKYRNANSSVSTEFTALLKAWGILETETDKKALKGDRKSVSKKSFHSIRHSLVTAARSVPGLPVDLVRSVVGHESEEVERAYFNPDNQAKDRVLEAMENYIAPTLKPYNRPA